MPFLGTTPTQGFVGANPKQSFTADGSTTVFTLTNPVATANDLEVFVGNVRQEPTSAYTAAGTTLTMSEAPATGLNFYVINKSQAQVTTTPPVNSISTDKIVASAVTNAKIAGMAASKLTGAMPAIDGSALTGIGADVSFIVRQASNQTLSRAAVTHITGFTNEDYDVQGVWASDAFTVPSGKAGLYLLYAQVNHQFNAIGSDGEYADVRWYKNGSGLNYQTRMTEMDTSGRHYKEISAQALVLVQLAVGDVLKIYASAADNNGSGNHTTQSANTYAFGYRVRSV